MDDHNVHHLWGISPAVDLLAVAGAAGLVTNPCEGQAEPAPINILQAGSYDTRHTITTLCQLHRHTELKCRPVNLYVYEEEPEVLLRHLLLLLVLFDGDLLAKERMETLLELHSNALLRDNTAAYLEEKGRVLESLLVNLSSRGAPITTTTSTTVSNTTSAPGKLPSKDPIQALMAQLSSKKQPVPTTTSPAHANGVADCNGKDSGTSAAASDGASLLASLLDISLLKFQDRDRMVEAVQKYRTSTQYDMVQAWDGRARKWYKERYDFRRNMIDWDYHMPMTQAATPGQTSEYGSIIHYHHFRHWRLHGVAYELRDARYNQPNRSMLSTAFGRTREFKDRNGKDVGRSVSAWGYWADILNSPYHCWGTKCEDDAFYQYSNKQWTRTAIDIAERNVLALLHELRTHTRYMPGDGEAHRARAARGPTSLADLREESEKAERAREQLEQQNQQNSTDNADGLKHMESIQEEGEEGEDAQAQQEPEPLVSSDADLSTKETGLATESREAEQSGEKPPAAEPSSASSSSAEVAVSSSQPSSSSAEQDADAPPAFQPSVTFQGPRPGYKFKRGPQGIGYYLEAKPQQAATRPDTTDAAPSGTSDSAQEAASTVQAAAVGTESSIATDSEASAAFQPSATFQGGRSGFVFKRGSQGMGYYPDSKQQQQTSTSTVAGASKPVQTEATETAEAVPTTAQSEEGRLASDQSASAVDGATNTDTSGLQKQAEALRAAEAVLDKAAASYLQSARIRIIPVLNTTPQNVGPSSGTVVSDLAKLLMGRAKYKGTFQVICVGHRHVHLVQEEHKLAQAAAPSGVLLVENARHLLQLKPEQATAFASKVEEMAASGGWGPASAEVSTTLRSAPTGSSAGMVVTDAHMLFTRK